jgi:hypothetical protein
MLMKGRDFFEKLAFLDRRGLPQIQSPPILLLKATLPKLLRTGGMLEAMNFALEVGGVCSELYGTLIMDHTVRKDVTQGPVSFPMMTSKDLWKGKGWREKRPVFLFMEKRLLSSILGLHGRTCLLTIVSNCGSPTFHKVNNP